MTAGVHEPQPVGALASRLDRILADRGIDPTAVPQEPEPMSAVELAEARIPLWYRNALPDHPAVTDWVAAVARAGRRGPGGTPGIAHGPSLLIAGPTSTGETHQAFGAVRSLDLHTSLRPRSGQAPEREIQALGRCPLLVLDDLGRRSSPSGPRNSPTG